MFTRSKVCICCAHVWFFWPFAKFEEKKKESYIPNPEILFGQYHFMLISLNAPNVRHSHRIIWQELDETTTNGQRKHAKFNMTENYLFRVIIRSTEAECETWRSSEDRLPFNTISCLRRHQSRKKTVDWKFKNIKYFGNKCSSSEPLMPF